MKPPYKYAHIVARLKEQTYSKLVVVQDGTVKDEEGKDVPVYKDTWVETVVKDAPLVLDIPFYPYAQTIVYLGKDITRRLHDIKAYEGKEVVACVAYSNDAVPHHNEVDESALAEKFAGFLGHKWKDVKIQPKYLANYSVTKEEKYATYDAEGNKTEYDGIDKLEVTKFRQFDEEVEAINEIELKEDGDGNSKES